MEIGIDASRLAVGIRTGTENYAFQITRSLLVQASGKDTFTLYFNQAPSAQLIQKLQPNADTKQKVIPYKFLWTHLRLSYEMYTDAPDVLFIPAHVLPLRHPARSVVTIHDLGYLYFPEAHTRIARLYHELFTPFSARFSRHLIAVSQATKNDLIHHYRVPAEKITVIHHGYDRELFQPTSQEEQFRVQTKYGLVSKPYLLYIGTLQPRKNLVRLLEAFASLIRDPTFNYSGCLELTLVLGGQRGWLSEPIIKRVQELALDERVKFTGYLPDADLPGLLGGAEAFVLPSLYEGFGMGVIEAMACGCPVVCSNAGSLPEVAGDAALLHHPLDRTALEGNLRRLLTNPVLREELKSSGFEQASKFSWERCAVETLEVLEKV